MVTLRPGTTLGSYVIEAALGSGAMGVVYRARDAKLQRTVAIKLLAGLSSDVVDQRVLREARAASAAASVRIGRSRLPPAKTLYRIASLMMTGPAGGLGR